MLSSLRALFRYDFTKGIYIYISLNVHALHQMQFTSIRSNIEVKYIHSHVNRDVKFLTHFISRYDRH